MFRLEQINRWDDVPDAKPKLRWLPFSTIVDTDVGRDLFIVEHREFLAALAFAHYLVLGRGCVVADLRGNPPGQPANPFDLDGIGVGIVYLNAEYWATNPAFPEYGVRSFAEREIILRIGEYNPDREIVLMLLSRDGLLSPTLNAEGDSPAPPEAYRRWSERASRFNPQRSRERMKER